MFNIMRVGINELRVSVDDFIDTGEQYIFSRQSKGKESQIAHNKFFNMVRRVLKISGKAHSDSTVERYLRAFRKHGAMDFQVLSVRDGVCKIYYYNKKTLGSFGIVFNNLMDVYESEGGYFIYKITKVND